jgi:urease accessory protein
MLTDTVEPLLYLLQVANASFPTGAFNHSYGLETWIDGDAVINAAQLETTCRDWLKFSLMQGDAAIVAQAYDAAVAGNVARLVAMDHVAAAIKLSREAREASDKTGHALLRALCDIFDWTDVEDYRRAIQEGNCEGHYPVIFGAAAATFKVPVNLAILTYLHSSLSNLVSVASRLIPLGQVESQRIIRNAWPALIEAADGACKMDPNLIGTAMIGLDVASMQHERLHTRLCIS